MPDILFIQGGGAGTHDKWDNRLVASLKDALGDGFTVHYPRIEAEADPDYATWKPQLLQELADIGDGATIVAHSVGATLLLRTLADARPNVRPRALFLIAAPFVGEGGWPGDAVDAGSPAFKNLPLHFYHGDADDEVPVSHLDLYGAAFPQAQIHRLPGRDHQLNNDLSEVAEHIK